VNPKITLEAVFFDEEAISQTVKITGKLHPRRGKSGALPRVGRHAVPRLGRQRKVVEAGPAEGNAFQLVLGDQPT
jgi:hypothetical protein